jgi:hypothetical protein
LRSWKMRASCRHAWRCPCRKGTSKPFDHDSGADHITRTSGCNRALCMRTPVLEEPLIARFAERWDVTALCGVLVSLVLILPRKPPSAASQGDANVAITRS